MSNYFRRLVLVFLCIIMLLTVATLAAPAADALTLEYYNDYETVAYIYNQGNCGSMQGFVAYGNYLYCAKINGNTEAETVITRTHKDTGSTVLMTNAATGGNTFTYLYHSNDLEVADIAGTTTMFVATGDPGNYSIVRFTMSGTTLTFAGNYRALYNGEEIYIAGVQVLRCDDTTIDLLVKKGKYYYYTSIGVNDTSGDIELTHAFTLDTYNVTINGVTKDLSTFLGQGFDYHDGKIYVPLTGNDQADISAIAVYDINGAHGTIINDPTLSFWIQSTAYAALFEIEGVCICPTDGRLYFNTNRRVSTSDTNHDGVHYISGFVYDPGRGTTDSANYRWEVIDDRLTSVTTGGGHYNGVNVHGGSIENGVFTDSLFNLNKAVILNHDEPWIVEWKSSGAWGESGLLFAESSVSKTEGASYLFRRKNSTLIALGEYVDGTFYNYGVQLGDHGIDGTVSHVYSLRNRIADDGSNMVYLYVDGVELGAMNNYHIAGTSQGTTSDWVSGKDFAFSYIGTTEHLITDCSIEYIQVWGKGIPWQKDEPNIFRWETQNDVLTAVSGTGFTMNTADAITGSISDGVFTEAQYQLDQPLVLLHDRPWSVEWQSEGAWTGGPMLFGTSYNSRSLNAPFVYRRPDSGLIAFGMYDGSQYNNYGLKLSDYGIDGTASHVYRFTNRIAADGSNMIYLYVDGVELGTMNNYYIGGTSKGTTSDWVSGKDFVFSYFATAQFTLNDCSMDYIQVWENGIPGEDVPQNYRWETQNDTLTTLNGGIYTANYADPMAGSCTDGVYSGSYFRLGEPVVLNHDRPWVMEWQSEGSWKDIASGAMLLSASNLPNELNAPYLYRRNDSQIIAFGERLDGKHRNYGISLADYGIDGTAPHVYRLENRVSADGSNMVYLLVDGVELGAMNQYFVAGTAQGTTSDWISGKDFVFPYMGTDAFCIGNCSIDYIEIYENGEPKFTVKFLDWDGTVLLSGEYAYGETVTAPADPTRPEDGNYTYTFTGWDADVTACTGDAVYTAVYEAVEIQGDPTLEGKSFTLSFEDEILVNFYFTAKAVGTVSGEDMGLLVWNSVPAASDIATADVCYAGALYDSAENRYMVKTEGIPAKEMGDERYYAAYAKLSDGTYIYTNIYGYSPKKYALSRIANSTDENMRKLCVAMLNYGAAAQEYFGYKTDDLMNASLTSEQQTLVAAYSADLFTGSVAADSNKVGAFSKTDAGFSKKTASVSFEGAFAINYYFTPSATVNGTMTMYHWTPDAYAAADVLTAENASGSVAMVDAGDGRFWEDVTGIAAKQIDDTYYVAGIYTDAAGNSYCTGVVAYSLSKYCINNAKDGNEMQDLAAATAMYGYYAKQYFS